MVLKPMLAATWINNVVSIFCLASVKRWQDGACEEPDSTSTSTKQTTFDFVNRIAHRSWCDDAHFSSCIVLRSSRSGNRVCLSTVVSQIELFRKIESSLHLYSYYFLWYLRWLILTFSYVIHVISFGNAFYTVHYKSLSHIFPFIHIIYFNS